MGTFKYESITALISRAMKEEFALFLDESGSPKPNPQDNTPYFAMGGIIVKRSDESIIKSSVDAFKQRWNIPLNCPLHGSEIRSKKRRFAWLGKLSSEQHTKFLEDLTQVIISSPILVHACVISRQGYLNRYLNEYGQETWEMMKSAFSILVERAAKYANSQNGTIMVYYEKIGKKEDTLIEKYFHELRSSGHPFNPENANKYSPISAEHLSQLLRGIEGKSKERTELQLADLCLFPVARSKDKPDDKAFLALKNNQRIVDSYLQSEQIQSLGIKYYCFDN